MELATHLRKHLAEEGLRLLFALLLPHGVVDPANRNVLLIVPVLGAKTGIGPRDDLIGLPRLHILRALADPREVHLLRHR
eukprot:10149345-Lingulodinium_polyedra.AAC.1